MKKQMSAWMVLVAVMAFGIVACSSGDKDAASSDASATDIAAVETPEAAPETPEAAPETPAAAPQETPAVEKDPNRFATQHDAAAIYTESDLPAEGSFLKIQFGDLTSAQMNAVAHRIKTELCTCGCPEDTIEECMVNDETCGTAPELARQIIREEKIKN